MKKQNNKLAFTSTTIHVLDAPSLSRVAGGLPRATDNTENCGVTYYDCQASENQVCASGNISCGSLACG
jgi:hypothetical protein